MMNDSLLDLALTAIDNNCDRIVLCSQAPTTELEAITTYMLGYRNTPTISAPGVRGAGGREITVSAITDGTVQTAGTATHYALVDVGGNPALLVVRPLSASKALVTGTPWTSGAITVSMVDDV